MATQLDIEAQIEEQALLTQPASASPSGARALSQLWLHGEITNV